MSATKGVLLKRFPSAEPRDIDSISDIWDEIVRAIIVKMLEFSDTHISDIHINLSGEMTSELAMLENFIAEKVVNDRLSDRTLEQIDEKLERESCFNEVGLSKITNTAKNLAEHVWIKKYNNRWKPKTVAAIKKEASPKATKLAPKKVENNHFIPKSFIKRYWSENNSIFPFTKNANGIFTRDEGKSFGQWGFAKNLYSDKLEAYFGLLEGDAVRPLEMLLSVEPLNRPQREALVGFIVIQRLRNPHFMASLHHQMKPIVADKVGSGRESDPDYMRLVYETLYTNNDFYNKLAEPIYRNQWVMVRSNNSEFVLPDMCNIFGVYNGNQYVV
ncbi:DUF4238 domain-containing protein, partial [Methyloglobulus morosus]|uniref:DUF4238 domain-containing protein n=1 Tax=Methyloglobulus morosus TaxID=1410681 RepID=UPI0006875076